MQMKIYFPLLLALMLLPVSGMAQPTGSYVPQSAGSNQNRPAPAENLPGSHQLYLQCPPETGDTIPAGEVPEQTPVQDHQGFQLQLRTQPHIAADRSLQVL